MNPSGGLFWHWHAWRHQARWTDTCAEIAQWLHAMPTTPTPSKELLILGASAGWMMPSSWLQGFARVTTCDLDRWAAPLFRLRHGAALRASGTALQCHTGDALTHLDTVLQAHPHALVLLDNVLGQLRFHSPTVEHAGARIARIARRLHGRRWGSVHDAFSGRTLRRPDSGLPAMQRSIQGATAPQGNKQSRPVALGRFSRQLQAHGEWLDHLTDQVFPMGTKVHHIAWPYSAGYCHWLQAGWVDA
ncbi:MAG: hypothetical protein ACKOWD_15930 [Rhodoferax sp.]